MKGAAVLFIEQALFIPNSKISSEKQLVGHSQDHSPLLCMHKTLSHTHTHTHTHTPKPGLQVLTISAFYTCTQLQHRETFTVYPAVC